MLEAIHNISNLFFFMSVYSQYSHSILILWVYRCGQFVCERKDVCLNSNINNLAKDYIIKCKQFKKPKQKPKS